MTKNVWPYLNNYKFVSTSTTEIRHVLTEASTMVMWCNVSGQQMFHLSETVLYQFGDVVNKRFHFSVTWLVNCKFNALNHCTYHNVLWIQ